MQWSFVFFFHSNFKPHISHCFKVGPGRQAGNGEYMKVQVKPGDKCRFRDYAGTEVKIEHKEYVVIKSCEFLRFFANDYRVILYSFYRWYPLEVVNSLLSLAANGTESMKLSHIYGIATRFFPLWNHWLDDEMKVFHLLVAGPVHAFVMNMTMMRIKLE